MKAYLWDKIIRVTLKARGVQGTLKRGPGKIDIQNLDSVLFSMPRETESYGYGSEDSGGLSETHASGNREYTRKVVQNMKDRLRHDESSSDISMNSEKDAHFNMDEIYGFIDASSIAHGSELRKEFGLIQEF